MSGHDNNTLCLIGKLIFYLKIFLYISWAETSYINYPDHSERLGQPKWNVDKIMYQPTWLSAESLEKWWHSGWAWRERRNLSRGMKEAKTNVAEFTHLTGVGPKFILNTLPSLNSSGKYWVCRENKMLNLAGTTGLWNRSSS